MAAAAAAAVVSGHRWWTADTVAVVTGANKGIGFHIAHGLADAGVRTVLTSRNPKLGQEAVAQLQAEGSSNVVYHQLDVADKKSIEDFARWLKQELGGLDILVNNAGIAFGRGQFGYEEAKQTLATNFFGVRAVTEALLPLMRPIPEGSRIVNVSSELGNVRALGDELQARVMDPNLTLKQLDSLAHEYLSSVQDGTYKAKGWQSSMYGASKVLLNGYTRVLDRELKAQQQTQRFFVNSFCPGWCRTDMGTFSAPRSAEQGADTAVFLALQPPSEAVSGKNFKDRTQCPF